MQTATRLFEEVLILYSNRPGNIISTQWHDLIKVSIDQLIADQKNHKKGFDFYIESAFDKIKAALPQDATSEAFKKLFMNCQIVSKGNSYAEKNQPFDRSIIADAVKRAKHEFYSLGNQAEDIMGNMNFI